MDLIFSLSAGMLIGFVMVYILMHMGVSVRNNFHIQCVFLLGHSLAALLTIFTERFLLSVLYPLGIIMGSGLGLIYQLFKQKSLATRIRMAIGHLPEESRLKRIRELQAKIDMGNASAEEVLEHDALMGLNFHGVASQELPNQMSSEEPDQDEEDEELKPVRL